MYIANSFKTTTMIKQIQHGGTTATMEVHLNAKVERRLGGERWHQIRVHTNPEFEYSERWDVNAKEDLKQAIQDAEGHFKKWVDKTAKSEDEKLLEGLGFEPFPQSTGN